MGPFQVTFTGHLYCWAANDTMGQEEQNRGRERASPDMLIFFSFKVTLRHQLRPLKVFLYHVTA